MNYVLKLRPELTFAVIVALATYLVQVLTDLNLDTLATWTDWRKMLVALVVGCIRIGLGAALASFTGGMRPGTPQVPTIDEEVGVSPRRVARPELPDKPDPPTHPGG